MPLVSVITAARNAAAFLGAAMDSIRDQSMADWEHVVVDDGSSDRTTDLVRDRAAQDARFRLVTNTTSIGAYRAANLGVERSAGQFIARLDADDLAHPRRLEAQLRSLRESPDCAASTGAWWEVREDGAPAGPVRRMPTRSNGVLKWRMFLRNDFVHSTLMIRRTSFSELGGYGPRRVAEDYRLWGRLVRRGWVAVTDEPLVGWRRHEAQTVADPRSRFEAERLEVRSEHMAKVTRKPCTTDDVKGYRMLGEQSALSSRTALRLLSDWEAGWLADTSLSAGDRRALARFTGRVVGRHIKRNSRAEPLIALTWAPRLLRSTWRGRGWE
ncbi:MAG TPA: glycosyltransferase family A protein [Acidimicrobiales bacterium]|nr:glycosyltransferase family A protein [Acidimicrobiales bacterium]